MGQLRRPAAAFQGSLQDWWMEGYIPLLELHSEARSTILVLCMSIKRHTCETQSLTRCDSTSWMVTTSRMTQLNPPPRNPPPVDLSTSSMSQLPGRLPPPLRPSAAPSVAPLSASLHKSPRDVLFLPPRSSPQSPASPTPPATFVRPTTAHLRASMTWPISSSKPPYTAPSTGTSAPPRLLAPAFPAAAPPAARHLRFPPSATHPAGTEAADAIAMA